MWTRDPKSRISLVISFSPVSCSSGLVSDERVIRKNTHPQTGMRQGLFSKCASRAFSSASVSPGTGKGVASAMETAVKSSLDQPTVSRQEIASRVGWRKVKREKTVTTKANRCMSRELRSSEGKGEWWAR